MNNNDIDQDLSAYHEKIDALCLPYPINILSEIHADENAHSRLLMKLLAFKGQDDKYQILNNFLSKFVSEKELMNEPRFTCNSADRIDLLIIDKQQRAIIIENKINGAPDQNKQITRYVRNVKNTGIENYAVIYLTDVINKKPNLSDQDINELGERLITLTYKNNILPWLENLYNTGLVYENEIHIKTTLFQYIEYLKIRYKMTDREMKTREVVNEYFGNKEFNSIEEIENYQDSVMKYLNEIDSYRKSRILKFFSKIKDKLLADNYQESEIETNLDKNTNADKYPRIGIKFNLDGFEFACIIEKRMHRVNEKPYVCIWDSNCQKKEKVNNFLKDIRKYNNSLFVLKPFEKKGWFYNNLIYCHYDQIESYFFELVEVIKEELKHS